MRPAALPHRSKYYDTFEVVLGVRPPCSTAPSLQDTHEHRALPAAVAKRKALQQKMAQKMAFKPSLYEDRHLEHFTLEQLSAVEVGDAVKRLAAKLPNEAFL